MANIIIKGNDHDKFGKTRSEQEINMFKFGYRRFKKRVRKLKHRILRTPNTTIGVHKGFSEIKKRRKNG